MREARKSAGISQAALARALGVKQTTVCGYEAGRRMPDAARAQQIARLLHVSADDLDWPRPEGESA